jgi:Fe/S biogenesis protein NfuA
MSTVDTERPIVTVTEAARSAVLEMRSAETDGESLALRIDVSGISEGGREFAYELMFEPIAEAREGDELRQSGELAVLIPAASVADLRGAVLDHAATTGLVIRNPNRPSPAMPNHTVVLEGSVEEKIVALLDGEINPSLAAHGGYATLQRVEDATAYITMGGGCQGCGLAALTLGEGIKAQIEDRIPEITEVIDVTNHADGENPFYEASAK